MAKMFVTHPSNFQVTNTKLYSTLFPTHHIIVESSKWDTIGATTMYLASVIQVLP